MLKSFQKSSRFVSLATLSVGAVLGCAPSEGVDETIQLTTGALLGNNEPINTVSVTQDSTSALIFGTRLGNGNNANKVIQYKRTLFPSKGPWALDPAVPVGTISSSQRPFAWWEQPRSAVTQLYTDPTDSKIKDTGAQLVFPNATVLPVGPVTAIETATDHRDLAFARFSDGSIRQATFTGTWTDTALTIGAVNPPNASPFTAKRSSISDSLWYGCGPTTGTRFCEKRIGPPGSSHDGLEFSTDFGAGTFIDGTRPTASAELNTNQRFIFAAVATSAGPKGIYARRDFGGSATGFTFGALQAIDTSSTATYSSPMPLSTSGGTSVFYFRTEPSAVSYLMMAKWNTGTLSWDPPQVIHNPSVQIPPGNDPTPYALNGSSQANVAFRLPFSLGMRDVVNLAGTSTGFVHELLPGSSYAPGLYAMGNSRFSSVNLATGTTTQIGPGVWTSTTAFTSDGMGLGYAVQNGPLFQVNFNDGTRRSMTSQLFTGATAMALSGASTLYVVQSNKLWKVDLITGVTTDANVDMTGVTSMATVSGAGTLFLRNGSLYSLSDTTKALGSPGFWAANATITAAPRSNEALINQPGAGLFVVKLTGIGTTNGMAVPVRASANLVAQPIAFDDTAWTKARTTVVANSIQGLDRTTTADVLKEDTTKNRHSMEQIVAVDPTRIYTWSMYVQPAGRSFFNLVLTTPEDPNSGADVVFNLANATVPYAAGVGTGALISASVEPVGTTGWFHVSVTGKPGGSGSGVRAMAYLMTSASVGTYTGNGSSGVNLWGAELKLANDFATPNQMVDADDQSKATWHKNRSSIVFDNTSAPNTAFPAYKLVEDTTNGTHYLDQFVTADATRPQTWSFYLKANGRTQASLYLTTPSDSSSGASVLVDLVAKTAVGSKSGRGTITSGQLVDLGNGWFRASVTGTATDVPGNQVRVVLYPSNGSAQGYVGDGTSGFYVWRGELRGMLDAGLSSPITKAVDVPANCNPGDATCADALYVLRASGQLGKLTGMALNNESVGGAGVGTTLGYANLGAATWTPDTLLAPRNY
jgi:hypothetical protein